MEDNNSTAPKNALEQLLESEHSLMMPVAHDAITARLIESLGFKTMAIGGFAIAATRFGYPDFGLVSYREMRDAVTEIARATTLPIMVDADNGYGEWLNVERTINDYEREPNISWIFLEDQVHPKRCGHLRGKAIINSDDMARKLRVAVAARSRESMHIMARTDARTAEGGSLDEALRRGEAYLKAGAEGLFIESPMDHAELEKIADTFRGVTLMVNMLDGGNKTPITPRADLEKMGYQLIAYPITTLLAAMQATKEALVQLRDTGDSLPIQDKIMPIKEFHDLVGVTDTLRKEDAIMGREGVESNLAQPPQSWTSRSASRK